MSTFQLSLPALRFFAALSCGAVTQRQIIARGVSASSVCDAAAELSLAGICRIVQIGSPALAGRAAISTLYGLSAPALPSAIAEHVARCGLGLSRVILFLSERTSLSAKSLAADIAMSYAATRSAIDAGRARGLIHPERLELSECNAVERPKNQHNAPTISTACPETALLNQAQHTSEQRPHAPDFAFDSVLKQKTVEKQTAVVDSEIEKLLIARGVAPTVAKSLAVNRAECSVQLQR